MVYEDVKDLLRRTICDGVLPNKIFNVDKNQKCDWYQHGVASVVYTFFDKMSSGGAVTCVRSETLDAQNKSATKSIVVPNQLSYAKLDEELRKQVIRKFEKRKV